MNTHRGMSDEAPHLHQFPYLRPGKNLKTNILSFLLTWTVPDSISFKCVLAACSHSWFCRISQWPSALGSSWRREDSYLADDTLRALGRALSWKDLFSLEIGSAFPAIIWSSWELVLLNTLPAWWEHMDFYSGLGIITNQTCDFGQIIWPLLHLSLLICLLGQLPLVCFICWISVRIKLWYLEIVNSEFIVRWYLYFVFHFFSPKLWFNYWVEFMCLVMINTLWPHGL